MLTRYNNSLIAYSRRHDHVEQAVARRSTHPSLNSQRAPAAFILITLCVELLGLHFRRYRGAAWKLAHLEAAVELGTRSVSRRRMCRHLVRQGDGVGIVSQLENWQHVCVV
jgi:hypothetical protein